MDPTSTPDNPTLNSKSMEERGMIQFRRKPKFPYVSLPGTYQVRMFAAVMRYKQNVVHIPRKYYETCPDFGRVYAAVKNMGANRSIQVPTIIFIIVHCLLLIELNITQLIVLVIAVALKLAIDGHLR